MKCLIDNRENGLISHFQEQLIENKGYFQVKQLEIGDIQIYKDDILHFIIERKSISDLAASIKDGRYVEQKSRLELFHNQNVQIIYIIEGELNTDFPHFKINGIPYGTLNTCMLKLLLKHKYAVIQSSDIKNTYSILMKIVSQLDNLIKPSSDNPELSEVIQNSKKKKSTDTVYMSMLCQIPGVSHNIAAAIIDKYPSIFHLCFKYREEMIPEKMLENIVIKKRKIGKVLSKKIYYTLCNNKVILTSMENTENDCEEKAWALYEKGLVK